MIKKFKIFEEQQNQLFDVEKVKLIDIIKKIKNEELPPLEISKYIKIDKDYKVEEDNYYTDNKGFSLYINEEDLEKIMGVENGVISHFEQVCSNYGGYEHYVDDEELNYVSNYLEKDTLNKIKKLAKFLKYKIGDIEENDVIYDFFKHFKLDNFVLEEVKWELSNIEENAYEKAIKNDVYDETPFDIEYSSGKLDKELKFNYDKVLEFLEKHKLENEISSIGELIEKVGYLIPWNYELQYDTYEYRDGYENVDNIVDNNLNKIFDFENNLPEMELWEELIKNDQLETIQKFFDEIDWMDKVEGWFGSKRGYHYLMEYRLMDFDKPKNPKCSNWFLSTDFQEKFIDKYLTDGYKLLKELKIMNSEIETKYYDMELGLDLGTIL